MHKQEACRLCKGSCVIDGEAVKCSKCDGNGAFSRFDKPCRHTDMHFARDCPICSGLGWSVTATSAYPGYPSMVTPTVTASVTPAGYPQQPAYPPQPQPTYPPQQQNIPQLAGDWGDASLSNDHLTILQAGDKYTITNAAQSWSPATAMAQNGEIVFTSGIVGLKATFDPMTQALNLSNNTQWVRRAPQAASRAPVPSVPAGELPQLGGKWGDVTIPGDEVVIVQTGNVLQITNRGQSWSPATGTVDVHNNVVFTSGLPGGLTAVHDGQAKVLRLSNGTAWNRHSGAHTGHHHGHAHHHHHAHGHAQHTPTPAPVGQVSLSGKWGDISIPGDDLRIVHTGTFLNITNPGQSWKHATGKFDQVSKTLSFNYGLTELSATYDVASQQLCFSNGSRWARHAAQPAPVVQQIGGDWQDSSIPGDEVVIVQTGDSLTITNNGQSWSPATGKIDAYANVTFVQGLPGLTARFDVASQALHLSNGTQWTRRAPQQPAYPPQPQPTYPPQQQNIPQLAGDWGDASLPNDHLTILQAGDKYTITNAAQSWSPATAMAQNGEIVFTSGIVGLKATFDPMTQALNLSNNTQWVRRAPQAASRAPVPSVPAVPNANLTGKWRDVMIPGDEVVIVQTGDSVNITNKHQSWSPAAGRVEGNTLTFTSGLPGMTATYEEAQHTLALSNNTKWCRATSTPQAPAAPGPDMAGTYGDVTIPGDACVVVQSGNNLTITNAKQGWSPATAIIDAQSQVTFTSGLVGMTARFDAPTRTLHLSNGTSWRAAATIATIQGKWHDPTQPGDETEFTQSGEFLTVVNARQQWSPAYAKIDTNRRITFNQGLPGVVGDLNQEETCITLNNGVRWMRGAAAATGAYPSAAYPPAGAPAYPPSAPPTPAAPSMEGQWQDPRMPGQIVTVQMNASFLTATCPTQQWSPAQGAIDAAGNVTFSTGLVGATAVFDPTQQIVRFSNGATWNRTAGAPPPMQGGTNMPNIQGQWRRHKAHPATPIHITQNGQTFSATSAQPGFPQNGQITTSQYAPGTWSFTMQGMQGTLEAGHGVRYIKWANGAWWEQSTNATAAAATPQRVDPVSKMMNDAMSFFKR